MRLTVTTDDNPVSVAIAAVFAKFELSNAWPWDAPMVHVATGVNGNGGNSCREDIAISVRFPARHALTGERIEIHRTDVFPAEENVVTCLAGMLEHIVLHELHEALFFDGRHVTEPHHPVLVQMKMTIRKTKS